MQKGDSDERSVLRILRDLERALLAYAHVFEEIESGRLLDPDRAKALKASTDALLREVADESRRAVQQASMLRELPLEGLAPGFIFLAR